MNIAKDIYSTDLVPVKGVKNFLEIMIKKYLLVLIVLKKRILQGLKKIQLENYFTEDVNFFI